jgi:hypothetical protein
MGKLNMFFPVPPIEKKRGKGYEYTQDNIGYHISPGQHFIKNKEIH